MDGTIQLSWSGTSAAELAEAAGAVDLFVFRRVGDGRFAHVGGSGRGAGWAGIVEVGIEDEPLIAAALASRGVVRRTDASATHAFGPYYGHTLAIVTVSTDVFVVFGATDGGELADDGSLAELAAYAAEALVEVAPAKRLADEVEMLSAVQSLLHEPAVTYEESLHRLADHAARALSCDLGLVFIPERDLMIVSDARGAQPVDEDRARGALAEIAARGRFPSCVQKALDDELPSPLSSADGVLAYYLLELSQPLRGVLLLLHTDSAAARGFTSLCQSLGAKLVEASVPLLTAALLRDRMNDELELAAAAARRDALTGLANRLAWDEALAAGGDPDGLPSSIVQVDCGALKLINDTFGHHVGDDLLRRIAAALRASVRDDDVVARLGGDEFAVLLRGADEETARMIVGRVEDVIASSAEPDQPAIRLAIGIATEDGDALADAQRRADAQMLEAKRARRSEGRLAHVE